MVFNPSNCCGHISIALKIDTITNGIKLATSWWPSSWHEWSICIQDIAYQIPTFLSVHNFCYLDCNILTARYVLYKKLSYCHQITKCMITYWFAFLPEHWLWSTCIIHHWHIVPIYMMNLRWGYPSFWAYTLGLLVHLCPISWP